MSHTNPGFGLLPVEEPDLFLAPSGDDAGRATGGTFLLRQQLAAGTHCADEL